MYIHKNIKFLRQRRGITQTEAATNMGLSRSQLAGYELHIKPTLETLMILSDYFGISADALLKLDFTVLTELKLRELEGMESQFRQDYIRGKNFRVLATTVDKKGKELTELVPIKAKAGYLNGYADPEYIGELESTHLPFLPKNRKYRIFQLEGDSMPPYSAGTYVVGSYMEDWLEVKSTHKYIILSLSEGIVFKVVYNYLKEEESLLLCSTNPTYEPFRIKAEDILEVWQFEWSIGR